MEVSLRQRMKIDSTKLVGFVSGATLLQAKTLFNDQQVFNKSMEAIA